MIALTLVDPEGVEHDLIADSHDLFVWERTTAGASFADLQDGGSMTDLYRIAHVVARREGLYSGKFAEFVETHRLKFPERLKRLAAAAVDGDGGELDPTRSARSGAA